MTQEQLDALLAQIGGAKLVYAPTAETKKIPNPAYPKNGGTDWLAPKEIDITVQRWHDPTSGRVIEAYQGADGAWTVTRNTTDKALVNVGAPEAGGQAAPRNVNGVPSVVIGRTEDGRPIYGPVQTEAGPAQAAPPAPKPNVIQIEGTPDPSKPGGFDNDRPVMTSHWPDGRVTYEPLTPAERQEWERQQGRGPKAQPTSEQGAVPNYPGWTFVTQTDGNGNKATLYYAPGDSTHPLRSLPAKPEGAPQPSTRVVKGGDGKEYIQSITFDQNGQPTAIKNYGPDGNPVAAIPGEAPDKGTVVSRNGQQYTVRAGKDANGNPTVETYDAQGNRQAGLPEEHKPGPVRYNPDTGEYEETTTDANGRTVIRTVPREGAPSGPSAAGGPAMPEFVVGAASQSLTDYHNALRNDPTLTPAQRERRFGEAMQTATMAVNESHIEQTDLDSTRSYNFNVASTKANYYQQGLGQALNFVARFNDKLPANSPLGGQALRALLGIQMLQMNASGLNQLNPGGVPTQPRFAATRGSSGTGTTPSTSAPGTPPIPAPPTPAELNDPDALERKRQEIMAHPAFKPPPPVEGQAGPGAAAPAAPTTPAPPPVPMPTVAPTSTPVPMPSVTTTATPAPMPTVPPTSSPPLTSPMQAPGTGPLIRVRDPYGNESQLTQRQIDNRPAGGPKLTIIGPVSMAPPASEPIPAAMTALAAPPREDFAVLKQMRPPEPAAPEAPAVAPPTPDLPTPPAMLRMQAMTTPPWRLRPEQIEQMQAAGIPDSVIFQARPQPLGSLV
jgi:hypothetical protein